MRELTYALGVLTGVNLALLMWAAHRNASLAKKLERSDVQHGELVRRLSRSHLAAVGLLAVCSPRQAEQISEIFAQRREALALAVSAVGEFIPTAPDPGAS